MIMANCAGPPDYGTSFEDPVVAADGSECRDAYPSDPPDIPTAPDPTDDQLEASLRRVLTAIDGLPPKVTARPADRDDFDCSAYPEGDGRHNYRVTASSHYGTGLDHPDYRDGETCWRCRRCGDVFVALDSEMAADEEDSWS